MVHFTIDAKRILAEGAVHEDEENLDAVAIEGIARVDVRSTVRIGDRAHFSVDVDKMQFFDPDTTVAIWR
jgi:hypothetical protein